MGVAFPLSPIPSWYADCSFPTRNGIFYSDGSAGAPSVTLSVAGATGYTVRDYTGTVVSSGTLAGTETTVTPTAPSGGWPCGWYRLYLTGPNTDSLFGQSYGATNFVVIPNDARFATNPAPSVYGGYGGEGQEYVTKGVLGIGTSRAEIDDVLTPNGDGQSVHGITDAQSNVALSQTYWQGQADGVRPRDMWSNFRAETYDRLYLPGASTGNFLAVYPATETVDGSQVFVAVSAGTSSGTKVQVYSPDSATLVETYDNLASDSAAATAINAASTRIKVFAQGQPSGAAMAATAIGNAYFTGVKQIVSTLYPDIQHFEGPSNEPTLNAECAHQMRLFAGAVHAGNAGAKAMGPCPVSLNTGKWDAFLAAGGGDWCDLFAFHDYNSMTGGNIPLGRTSIGQWIATLTRYGQQGKARWQTESGTAFKSVYGVHHPRRAVWKLIHTLLWEQNGLPAERNTPWYDKQHGFWSFPAWIINSDTSLNPDAIMLRTLTAETWAKTYASKLSFGPHGDNILLGNVYSGSDGTSTVVICASSQIPNLTVTLTVTGASGPLTTVDAWGNTSSVAVSGGRVTLPAPAHPVFLRLPAGASVSVYTIADWPQLGVRGQGDNSAIRATATSPLANDRQWMTVYDGNGTGAYLGPTSLPDDFTLHWPHPTRFDRVLLWNGMSWQLGASLLDFDIQTSSDGTTWITQATVTRTADVFLHGTSAKNAGTQYETYWDEQWIWDVKLPAPVTASYLRLHVRNTSYGGEPDATTNSIGGQGGPQRIMLQEVAVLCDDNVSPQYVTA
jgi:hypothetical protein